jgi:[NiFe] hydrogenase diaphorase moiety small subunit
VSDDSTIHFSIDGVGVTAKPGQTIIDACDDAGIYIPRLCYKKELQVGGNCRLCTCVVNGRHIIACGTPATHGIAIENASKKLLEQRSLLIEMLFVEGDHPCPFCEKSGACELQAMAYRFGIAGPHLDYQNPDREIDASHPEIFIDRHTCIQCGMCVRASRDLDRKTVFGFENRGTNFRIVVDSPEGLGATSIATSDHAANVCPVGAIVVKHTGYAVPYGERVFDKTPIGIDHG